jgi:hypothetical protein
VRDGQLVINVTEQNPFLGTALDNQFVFQSYFNERCYFTTPLMRRILTPSPAVNVARVEEVL